MPFGTAPRAPALLERASCPWVLPGPGRCGDAAAGRTVGGLGEPLGLRGLVLVSPGCLANAGVLTEPVERVMPFVEVPTPIELLDAEVILAGGLAARMETPVRGGGPACAPTVAPGRASFGLVAAGRAIVGRGLVARGAVKLTLDTEACIPTDRPRADAGGAGCRAVLVRVRVLGAVEFGAFCAELCVVWAAPSVFLRAVDGREGPGL